jgi:hypothetical protein
MECDSLSDTSTVKGLSPLNQDHSAADLNSIKKNKETILEVGGDAGACKPSSFQSTEASLPNMHSNKSKGKVVTKSNPTQSKEDRKSQAAAKKRKLSMKKQ